MLQPAPLAEPTPENLVQLFRQVEELTQGTHEELLALDRKELHERDRVAGPKFIEGCTLADQAGFLSDRVTDRILRKTKQKLSRVAKVLGINIDQFFEEAVDMLLGIFESDRSIRVQETVFAILSINVQSGLMRKQIEKLLRK